MKPTRNDLRIRRATEADVALLLSLIRGLAEYEKLAADVVATEERLRESLFSEPPRAEALLAELVGEPVGFAVFFHNYSTFLGRAGLYLEDLFVLPAFRRQGYGRDLLAHVAGLAVERGCERMEWCVLDWNQPALNFYEELGAEIMNDWKTHRVSGEALQRLARA